MSQPGKYDLALYRGDTYAWRFQLWADDERTDPADLTGAVAEAEIRDKPNGATIVELDCTITLPNIIDVALAADAWVDTPLGAWDLELTYLTGEVRTVVAGKVVVTPDVTNSAAALAAVSLNGRRAVRA